MSGPQTGTARVAARWLRESGLLEPPPAMLKAVTDWVLDEAKKVWKDPSRAQRTTQRFPLDLEGWKYLRDVDRFRNRIVEQVEGWIADGANNFSGNTAAVLNLLAGQEAWTILSAEEAQDIINDIDRRTPAQIAESIIAGQAIPLRSLAAIVEPEQPAGHRGNVGGYRDGSLTIWPLANMPEPPWNWSDLGQATEEIREAVGHELTHYAQKILSTLHGITDAGLPSPRMRTPDESEHALLDREFYTRLRDEVARFRASHDPKWLKEWDQARRIWIGQARRNMTTEPSDFFTTLRKHAPDKYQKAVGEFWKATEPTAT